MHTELNRHEAMADAHKFRTSIGLLFREDVFVYLF
jgi:hypothetical protein